MLNDRVAKGSMLFCATTTRRYMTPVTGTPQQVEDRRHPARRPISCVRRATPSDATPVMPLMDVATVRARQQAKTATPGRIAFSGARSMQKLARRAG